MIEVDTYTHKSEDSEDDRSEEPGSDIGESEFERVEREIKVEDRGDKNVEAIEELGILVFERAGEAIDKGATNWIQIFKKVSE